MKTIASSLIWWQVEKYLPIICSNKNKLEFANQAIVCLVNLYNRNQTVLIDTTIEVHILHESNKSIEDYKSMPIAELLKHQHCKYNQVNHKSSRVFVISNIRKNPKWMHMNSNILKQTQPNHTLSIF